MENSPVEISITENPNPSSVSFTEAKKLFDLLSIEPSTTVPGLTTLVTPLLTRPFVLFGSSSCSQIATRCPFFINLFRYVSKAWYGTPANGIGLSEFLSLAVREISKSFATILASSPKVS